MFPGSIRSITIISFFLFSTAYAQTSIDYPSTPKITIAPHIGFRFGETLFNVAGNEHGKNPNILSEIIWSNTSAISYGSDFQFHFKHFFLSTSLNFNSTIHGDVSDIDYAEDNRKSPYSELKLSNHKGEGISFTIEPGYKLQIAEKSILNLYLSYEYLNQYNYLLNYKHWSPDTEGYQPGLNSYYKYAFPNYGLGTSISMAWSPKWSSEMSITTHLSKYNAVGNWNLRDNFEHPISYKHEGTGYKIKPKASMNYNISSSFGIKISYILDYFYLQDGKDYVYKSNGETVGTMLNEVKFSLQNILFSINKSF